MWENTRAEGGRGESRSPRWDHQKRREGDASPSAAPQGGESGLSSH